MTRRNGLYQRHITRNQSRGRAAPERPIRHRRGDEVPSILRGLVQDAIGRHLPAEQFEVLKTAEQSEREIIARLVEGLSS
jgi:hypothetical protein